MKKYINAFGLIIVVFLFDLIQTYTGYKLIKILSLITFIIFIFYILKLLKSLIVDEYLMTNSIKKKIQLLIGIIGFIVFILSIAIGVLLFGEFPKLIAISILFSIGLITVFLILEIWNYEKRGKHDE